MHFFTRKRSMPLRKPSKTGRTAGLKQARELLTVVCTVVAAALLVTSGTLFIRQSGLFKLKELKIFGCNLTTPEDLMTHARIEKGTNLLALDLNQKSTQLEQSPYIYRAVLERTLPGTLEIHVDERTPRAVIKLDDFYLIDEHGEVFKEALSHELHYPELSGLTKDDLYRDSEHCHYLIRSALALLDVMEKDQRFAGEKHEILIDKNAGFTIIMNPGRVAVCVGFGDFAVKLESLWKIVDDLTSKGLTPETIHLKSAQKAYVTLKG